MQNVSTDGGKKSSHAEYICSIFDPILWIHPVHQVCCRQGLGYINYSIWNTAIADEIQTGHVIIIPATNLLCDICVNIRGQSFPAGKDPLLLSVCVCVCTQKPPATDGQGEEDKLFRGQGPLILFCVSVNGVLQASEQRTAERGDLTVCLECVCTWVCATVCV